MTAGTHDDHATPETRYAAAAGLRVHDFGEQCAVFDPLSWDAHLLNRAAIAVLDLFAEGPHSAHDVAAFLAEALRPEDRAHAADHARELIAELASLGLIRAVNEDEHAFR